MAREVIRQIEYADVEAEIKKILSENSRPSLSRLKDKLHINDDKSDEVIEYYLYMWEQRHTATYLDDINASNLEKMDSPHELGRRALQLEESLSMMRATIEATEDGLIMINKEGKLVGFNKKLVDIVGLPKSVRESKDETAGLDYLFSQVADPQELATIVRKKYLQPEPGPCGDMHFKNGKVVERFYQPQIVNNQVVGHVWSLRDVTLKRKQEESLRLANRAINASKHAIIIIENHQKLIITYVNPSCKNLFEIADDSEVLGKSFFDLSPDFAAHKDDFVKIFNQHHDGKIVLQTQLKAKLYWLEISVDAVYDREKKNITHYTIIINDITKNKELESILQYKAIHDTLTGLPNKAYVEDAIRYRIKKSLKNKDQFGILFIDIDRFKNINDTLGHKVGDHLLRLFGKRLQNSLKKSDVGARIGGDEFIILIDRVKYLSDLDHIANRLLESSRKTFSSEEHEFNITISIGVVSYPLCGQDTDTLIRNADIAMYQAKRNGRNQIFIYDASLNQIISRRVQIENQLHNAIINNEFELHYQPIYSIKNKKFTKAEVLLRWNNKALGKVSPVEFIPILEDIGMISTIGRWVIEQVIMQIETWKNDSRLKDIVLSINVSAKQLADEGFSKEISTLFETYKIPASKILLEITESFFLLEEKVTTTLSNLNALGVKIAIDDFGTGYSNLNYLNKLHVHSLKIDKSFVDQIGFVNFDDSVILAIMAIAKRMNFQLVAEGVETKKQYDFLVKNECDEIQGYYFSKPLPREDFVKFVSENN